MPLKTQACTKSLARDIFFSVAISGEIIFSHTGELSQVSLTLVSKLQTQRTTTLLINSVHSYVTINAAYIYARLDHSLSVLFYTESIHYSHVNKLCTMYHFCL